MPVGMLLGEVSQCTGLKAGYRLYGEFGNDFSSAMWERRWKFSLG